MTYYVGPGPWGPGEGGPLSHYKFDNNNYGFEVRITNLETNPPQPNDIVGITLTGSFLSMTQRDGTILGPVPFSPPMARWRSEWAIDTSYIAFDFVTVSEVGLFGVLQDHTSSHTAFDANATDVDGNLLYRKVIGFSGTTATIDDLLDVVITSAANKDMLVYDSGSTHWVNKTPTQVTANLLGSTSGILTANGSGGLGSITPASGIATFLATPSSANLRGAITDETGTGAAVFATSPALVTPDIGTPSAGTLTNATGLPVATGISGLGTGIATFLATPSSANLRGALTDEVGTGAAYFVGGALGTPASGTLTNATGLPVSGISSISDLRVLSNVSGGSASPSANTMTAILDAVFSGTQGAILYRGASGWAALSPGTSGNVLTTVGAGGDPSWTTAGGGSGLGDVSGGSTSADGELAAYSGTGGKTLKQSFAKFSGPASSVKTYTLPNASSTILTDNAAVTVAQGGTNATSASGTALDNITGFASTGIIGRTGSGAYSFRTITGTSNRLSVSNGDGVSGNPTIDIHTSYVGQNTITTLGTISTGTWAGTAVAVDHGGTGQTSYTDGQLLIGNTATGGLSKATLTAGSNVTITNGNGTITIASSGGGGGGTPGGSSGDIQTNDGAGGFGAITPASGIATFLATPSSANLRTVLTDETGTGAAVFATSPTLVTPILGTPTSGALTNCTSIPVANATGTLPVANGGTGQTSYTNGQLLIGNTTGNTLAKAALTAGNGISITNGASSITIAASIPPAPQGRLTLTSNTPVMSSDATAATTIYYAAYVGNYAGLGLTIGSNQISMGLDTTNHASGSVYDIFVVNNSGAAAICTGPAWSSVTSRGAGAGTTELARSTTDGLWYNANSMTHAYGGASGTTDYGSVSAGAALYIGSVYCTANGQTKMMFAPSGAAGGSNPFLALYNAYNRVPTTSVCNDSTSSWAYSSTTWRSANNSSSNRITWVDGLGQSQVTGMIKCGIQPVINNSAEIGINIDSTTNTPSLMAHLYNSNVSGNTDDGDTSTEMFPYIGTGLHYAQAMEARIFGSGSITFWGGIRFMLRATLLM